MRLLLDTPAHALIWWLSDSSHLTEAVRHAIFNPSNGKPKSAAAAWRITTKHRLGNLRGPHRDAFDRMLTAQALARNLVLISNESLYDRYGVRRLWHVTPSGGPACRSSMST